MICGYSKNQDSVTSLFYSDIMKNPKVKAEEIFLLLNYLENFVILSAVKELKKQTPGRIQEISHFVQDDVSQID